MATKAFNQNLKGFRQTLQDFSRSFMFRINIPGWYGNSDTLSMLGRTVTLPSYKLKSEQIAFQGMQIMVSPVAEFDHSFKINMLADEKQVLRGNIMKWMSFVYDPATMEASTLGGDNGYKRDNVVVQQLNRMGETIMSYQFYGVYPASCSAPTLSQEDTKAQTFDVDFSYDFFTYVVDDKGTIASGAGNDVGAANDKVGIFNAVDDGVAGAADTLPKQERNKPPVS
jgi:hypothetical protein